MQPPRGNGSYERLVEDEDEQTSEAAQLLAPLFEKLRERLAATAASRPPGAGIVAALSVGSGDASERWLIDTRDGVPLSAAIARSAPSTSAASDGSVPQPTISLHVPEPSDLLALLERRLPPFRALAQRRIVLTGDFGALRSMSWLLGGSESGGDGGGSAVSVRVTHTDTSRGHGAYTVRVEEGAVSWSVTRRWSELKAMTAELLQLYGKGSGTLELQLPTLPISMRSSTSPALLAARSRQMAEHVTTILSLLPCSPSTPYGPPALLRFLLPSEEPPDDAALTSIAAEAGPTASSGGGRELSGDIVSAFLARGEMPLRELLLRRELELQTETLSTQTVRARRATMFACALLALILPLALLIAAVLSEDMLSPQGGAAGLRAAIAFARTRISSADSAPSDVYLSRTIAMSAGGAVCAIGLACMVFHCCCCCSVRGRERLSLLRRYVAVVSLFWTVIAHYRLVRLRAKRLALLEEEADDAPAVKAIWEDGHDLAGRLLHAGMSRLGGLWIKQGQYLASRADMVPKSMGQHLAAMLDSNPPRPLAEVVSTLLSELGDERVRMIASIHPTPLSTASIAQVHTATLVDGTRVVLKIQHVEVETKMLQDLQQAEHLAEKLAWLEPQVDLRPLLEEAASLHRSELDFAAEASNLREVAANLRGRCVTATLPPVVESLTTRRCLTMGYCEGAPLKDAVFLRSIGVDCALLVSRVCEAWAAQMFADGVFNCDPHPGNLLVRVDPQRGPVPVLLDFGLCKRLPVRQKLAFCSMVVSLSLLDADGLVRALATLGLQLPPEADPFTVLRGLAFAFRDTEADAGKARERIKGQLKRARTVRQQIVAKRKERIEREKREDPTKEEPRRSLPGVVAYFYRTLMMLQGLATNLGVSLSFMPLLARWAQQTLLENARAELVATARRTQTALPITLPTSPLPTSPLPSSRAPWYSPMLLSRSVDEASPSPGTLLQAPRTSLQERVLRLLTALADTDELLGAQVCVYRHGRLLVDAAMGRMGPVDPRPVQSDSLFQVFEGGSPLLATLALQEASMPGGALRLTSPLSEAWPAFGVAGKAELTLLELLTHRSGLKGSFPPDATIADLCDVSKMAQHVAASSAAGSHHSGSHEGLPWGWALWGVLHGTVGETADTLLARRICAPLSIPTDPLSTEMTLHVPPGTPSTMARVVMHDASAMMRRSGLDLAEVLASPQGASPVGADSEEAPSSEGIAAAGAGDADGLENGVEGGTAEHGDGGGGGGTVGLRGMLGGAKQMLSPPFLNMEKLRTATLPGISMHVSARALATFYHGVGSAQLLPADLVDNLVAQGNTTVNHTGVQWAAGFQLGSCLDSSGRRLTALGHGAGGGSVGLCVPECGVALAVTVSKLSASRVATGKIVDAMLGEFGLRHLPCAGLLKDA